MIFKTPKKSEWVGIESEVVRVKGIYGLVGLPAKKTTGLRGSIKTIATDLTGKPIESSSSSEFELEIISAVGGDFAMLSAVNLKHMEGVVVAVSPLDEAESNELYAAIGDANNDDIIRIVASANVYVGRPPMPIDDDDDFSDDYGDE